MQEVATVGAEGNGSVDPDHFLRERYAEHESHALLGPYYALKPLLPRRLQLAMRRRYARRQSRREFPRWPAEDVLVRHQHDCFRAQIRARGGAPVPFVN